MASVSPPGATRTSGVRVPWSPPYLDLFASTWTATGGTGDLFTGYLPRPSPRSPGEGTPVQVLHSSVSTPAASIRDLFILALTSARQRVWIRSPYFVPDEPTLTAMCVAAASGVDVRLMITGHADKNVPFHAAHAYFGQLLASDVRVFLYTAGFLHAKTVTMDDDVAVVGTATGTSAVFSSTTKWSPCSTTTSGAESSAAATSRTCASAGRSPALTWTGSALAVVCVTRCAG